MKCLKITLCIIIACITSSQGNEKELRSEIETKSSIGAQDIKGKVLKLTDLIISRKNLKKLNLDKVRPFVVKRNESRLKELYKTNDAFLDYMSPEQFRLSCRKAFYYDDLTELAKVGLIQIKHQQSFEIKANNNHIKFIENLPVYILKKTTAGLYKVVKDPLSVTGVTYEFDLTINNNTCYIKNEDLSLIYIAERKKIEDKSTLTCGAVRIAMDSQIRPALKGKELKLNKSKVTTKIIAKVQAKGVSSMKDNEVRIIIAEFKTVPNSKEKSKTSEKKLPDSK